MTATTTGFTPARTGSSSGRVPQRTYTAASTPVTRTAGRMKQIPAVSSPGQPPRRYPTWIAISVELGPGIRCVAPRRSRKLSRDSHLRRPTTSSSIMAMCAAGPPKPMVPSFRKRRAIAPTATGRGSFVSVIGSETLL